jgi:hypothetical protein
MGSIADSKAKAIIIDRSRLIIKFFPFIFDCLWAIAKRAAIFLILTDNRPLFFIWIQKSNA